MIYANSRRVLIAEDDPVISRLVVHLVQKQQYKPVLMTDGGAAYRLLQTDADFCGAIFDMNMPHLDGIDVIRFMRTENRLMRIPVMMVTANRDLSLLADSFAAGVTLFLPKPFTSEQFESTFRLLLQNNQPRNKN